MARRRRFAYCSVAALLALAVAAVMLSVGAQPAVAMAGMTNCTASGCHLGVRTSSPVTHAPIDCNVSGCHVGEYGTGLQSYDMSDHIGTACTWCHGPSFPAVTQHTAANLEPPHQAPPATMVDCTDCHSVSLITEHEKDPLFVCTTCHASTDPLVLAAIAANNTQCASCHDIASGHEPLHDTTVPAGCTGTGCHNATNLLPLHPAGCASCHASTDPDVMNAIATGSLDCASCHGAVDHGPLHDTTVPAGCTGTGCHNATNLVPLHADNCATCHSSTDPNVVNAIATGSLDCVSCHPTTDHEPLHDTTVPAGCTGTGCHNATNLVPLHADNCATCHASTDPDVMNAISTGSLDCASCHGAVDHEPLHDTTVPAGCTGAGCHNATNLVPLHADNCATCHASTDPDVMNAIATGSLDCASCHGAVDHEPLHDTTVPAGCTGTGCHNATNLVPLHADNCATCHASTDPDVMNAIATGSLDCASCHGAVDHEAAHDTTVPPGCSGSGCHEATNLVPLHADNCATCHSSTDPNVVNAIATGDLACVSCHPTTDHEPLHDTTVPAGCTGTGCHNATNLVPLHADNCATCHASTDPDVMNAIATGSLDCASCHDTVDHGPVHDTTVPAGCTGTGCHNATNLVPLHPAGCASCHASSDQNVIDAIAEGDKACASCHPNTNHASSHMPIIEPACNDCHGSAVVSLHGGDCGVCHSSTIPPGATCTTCHSDIDLSSHGFPIYNEVYNPNHSGYLAWSYVKAQTGAVGSPHGNYSTSTNKCAVCHAVHRADPDGVVLTAWGGKGSATPAFSSTMAPFESCFFCHGNGATFTDKTVEFFVTSGGVLSPHTTCGRCHTASPHGAGSSEYAILSSKLINDHADPQLDVDLRDGNNGLTADMFDLTSTTKVDQGLTLATGYLCVGCHGSNTNEHVFAVNERGATPAIHYTSNPAAPGDDAAPGNVTGHQVWIGASSTWNNPGTWYSGGGAHDYYLAVYRYNIGGVDRAFKVKNATTFIEVDPSTGETSTAFPGTPDVPAASIQALGWDSTIAFNNAYGCASCHDATRSNGKLAFPHGYVNAAGAPAPKWSNRTEPGAIFDGTTLETSFLWLTIAPDADDTRILNTTTGNNNIDANMDGVCLKCHLSGNRTRGVGETY